MTRITQKQRDKMPKKDFAIPSHVKKGPRGSRQTRGAYPMDTKSRARNALARVSQFGTPAEKKQVRAAVHKKYPAIGKRKSAAKKRS